MAYNRPLITIFFLALFLFLQSCGGARKINSRYAKSPAKALEKQRAKVPEVNLKTYKSNKKLSVPQRVNNYISAFSDVARQEMEKYDIPASITLAQGILESGMGESRLAVKANNHFGIKCHTNWRGSRIYHDDDRKGECFRVYKDPRTSYRDHSLFLTTRSRYDFLFQLKLQDYKGWAKGLKRAGYATDPKYPDKLISLIERYRLDRFDGVKRKFKKTNELAQQPMPKIIHLVQKGDTLYSISKKYKVDLKLLVQENRIENNIIILGQKLIIPQTN